MCHSDPCGMKQLRCNVFLFSRRMILIHWRIRLARVRFVIPTLATWRGRVAKCYCFHAAFARLCRHCGLSRSDCESLATNQKAELCMWYIYLYIYVAEPLVTQSLICLTVRACSRGKSTRLGFRRNKSLSDRYVQPSHIKDPQSGRSGRVHTTQR